MKTIEYYEEILESIKTEMSGLPNSTDINKKADDMFYEICVGIKNGANYINIRRAAQIIKFDFQLTRDCIVKEWEEHDLTDNYYILLKTGMEIKIQFVKIYNHKYFYKLYINGKDTEYIIDIN